MRDNNPVSLNSLYKDRKMQSNHIKTSDNCTTSEYQAGLVILAKLISDVDYVWESQPERKSESWVFKAEIGLSDIELEDIEFKSFCVGLDMVIYDSFHKEKLEYLHGFLQALATAQRITHEQFDEWNLQFDSCDSLQYSISEMCEFYKEISEHDEIPLSCEKKSTCKLIAVWLEKFRRAIAPPDVSCGWIGFSFDDFYIG